VGIDIVHRIDLTRALGTPLDQQLDIKIAGLVSPETIPKHVVEIIKAEGLAASLIRPVEERAMLALGWHTNPRFPADSHVIDRGGGEG
jgi:hypothetical protein